MHTNTDTVAGIIIALERQALDHWNRGDVEGQLRFYAEDVTYFDPITPTRIDGWPAVADYFRRAWAGKVNILKWTPLSRPFLVRNKVISRRSDFE